MNTDINLITHKPKTERIEAETSLRFIHGTFLVTGAATGAGRAITLKLAREGGDVIACDQNILQLKALKEEFPDLKLSLLFGDVADDNFISSAIKVMKNKGNRLDGLVNNAGNSDGFLPLHETTDSAWKKMIDVNLTAPFRLSRALLPFLQNSSRASIVNIASEPALRRAVSGTTYTVSKHALVGLTRSTAFLYDTVRCNAIIPGGISSKIESRPHQVGSPHIWDQVIELPPYIALPNKIASLATFLLSDDASGITGIVIPFDGSVCDY